MFTWIPLYQQIAHNLLEFENRQGELLALLRRFADRGLQITSLEDEDTEGNRFPLTEIDPFTFFATFNWQGRKPEKRSAILAALRDGWKLDAPTPTDFDGIPLGNRQNLWLFSFQKQRDAGDIPRLWQLARQVIGGTRATVDRELFARVLKQRNVGEVNLSVGMFWLNPKEFLPADKWTRGYMERRGVCMVQFHPSYGYEDFIQGYRPDGTGLRLRNGVFHEFARRAQIDGRPHIFIIDEINRGNLAKIFGELLMLLEADKRGTRFALPLTYAESVEEKFWLPENLHVIGTMNTADRSLAMVDYALRRRFGFVALSPALHRPEFQTWLAEKGAPAAFLNRIADRVERVNQEITAERDLGAGFRIGHSYFCPVGNPKDWNAWYEEIIEAEIAPLLEEYFDTGTRAKDLIDGLLAV